MNEPEKTYMIQMSESQCEAVLMLLNNAQGFNLAIAEKLIAVRNEINAARAD